MLHELLLAYEVVLERTVTRVRDHVDVLPTSRIKNTGTILEKLRRHGGSWLKSIQDIAGMRIVGSFDRNGQDALVDRLVALFANERRKPRVIDRRATPMHGYTAFTSWSTPADSQSRSRYARPGSMSGQNCSRSSLIRLVVAFDTARSPRPKSLRTIGATGFRRQLSSLPLL
ncbi:MAG TPA: hypothetical protein VLK58_23220 [Conexibacter sp.]|nr:hypothetical protein [Conexibacter sp.]